MLFSAYRRVERVVESGEMEDIDTFLSTVCLGGRSSSALKKPDGSKIEAFNILTAIDKVSKEFKRYRENYEFLSDFAHPNAPGAMLAYGHIDKNKNIATFSFDAPYKIKSFLRAIMLMAFSKRSV